MIFFLTVSVAHPGVGHYIPEDQTRVHKYYQWVCFVLFFQAVAFYIPRLAWKQLERGRIYAMSSDSFFDLAKNEDKLKKKRKLIVEYFLKSRGTNDTWALKYAFCEILNFVNVIIQIDLTDKFVGRAFSSYGLSLIQFSSQNPLMRSDAMAKTFPTVTKCTFTTFGPTGNLIKFDR